MGLKQDIVVVNEFSMKTGSKGGTRGGTPGDYVLRYMARKGATEELTPVRLEDQDAYVTRYMARREATETFDTVSGVKQGMRSAQGLGGVAFGSTGRDDPGDMSMSDRKIRRVSKDIQRQFDEGKTVLKTVLSFDTEYLRRMGVVDAGFEPRNRGDFRGNIDQMKLRLAVMDGMRKLGRKFDDLEGCHPGGHHARALPSVHGGQGRWKADAGRHSARQAQRDGEARSASRRGHESG